MVDTENTEREKELVNEPDPEEVVREFIERDQSGGGYQRRWDRENVLYEVPSYVGGTFRDGALAVGDAPLEWEDDGTFVIYAVIVPKECPVVIICPVIATCGTCKGFGFVHEPGRR